MPGSKETVEQIDEVQIVDIVMDDALQMRQRLSSETVQQYADLIDESDMGWPFPPVQLAKVKDKLMVVDGWHRIEAAKLVDRGTVKAVVKVATLDQAFRMALAANANHGLPRTNADKRKAVMAAIERWPNEDSRKIAKKCRVSHTFVNGIKKQSEPATPVPATPVPVGEVKAAEAAGNVSISRPKEPHQSPVAVPAVDDEQAAFDAITDQVLTSLDAAEKKVPASCRGQWLAFLTNYVKGVRS